MKLFESVGIISFHKTPSKQQSGIPSSGLAIGSTGRIPGGPRHFWAEVLLAFFSNY